MHRAYASLFAFFLVTLSAVHAERIDHRNFAIDTCFPSQNAIQLAEGRTRAYWAKHASRYGAEPRCISAGDNPGPWLTLGRDFPLEAILAEVCDQLEGRITWVRPAGKARQ